MRGRRWDAKTSSRTRSGRRRLSAGRAGRSSSYISRLVWRQATCSAKGDGASVVTCRTVVRPSPISREALAQRVELEGVVQALAPGLEDQGEVAKLRHHLQHLLGSLPVEPEGGAPLPAGAGQQQGAAGGLAEAGAEEAGVLELLAQQLLDALGGNQREGVVGRGAGGVGDDDAVVAVDDLGVSAEVRPPGGGQGIGEGAVDAAAPHGVEDELAGEAAAVGRGGVLDDELVAVGQGCRWPPSAPRGRGAARPLRPAGGDNAPRARGRSRGRRRPAAPARGNGRSGRRGRRTGRAPRPARTAPWPRGCRPGTTKTSLWVMRWMRQLWTPRLKVSPTARSQTNSSSSWPRGEPPRSVRSVK